MSLGISSPIIRLTNPLVPWVKENLKSTRITQLFFFVLGLGSGTVGMVLMPKAVALIPLSLAASSFLFLTALFIAENTARMEQSLLCIRQGTG